MVRCKYSSRGRESGGSGGDLTQILDAGEWLSPAFLKYLDVSQLEKQVAVQAYLDDSDEEA